MSQFLLFFVKSITYSVPFLNDATPFTALDEALDAPPQYPQSDLGAAFLKMLLSLILLISLLVMTLWFIRKILQQRLEKGNENQSIQILEKRVLSPKTILYLIEVDGKRTLIAESQLEIRRIDTIQEYSEKA
jgi:flagellar biogenesis protein FliO